MLGGTLVGAVIGGVLMLQPSIHPDGIQTSDAIAPFACGGLGLLFGMLLAAAVKNDRR